MRSRTSYFNRTLFLKTVTRFWPLWFFYFAAWFLAMPLVLSSNLAWNATLQTAQSNVCAGATILGVIIGMISACVAAMAAWSFMYSSRSAGAAACLPIRREGVFLSVSLGGLVPLLAVNALIFLLSLGTQALYGVVDAGILAQWLAAVTLELVFFYGFALLCAQLTGNLAVLPAVYLVLNFTVYVLEAVFASLASAFIFGAAEGEIGGLAVLSPPFGMLMHFNMGRELEYFAAEDYYEVAGYYLEGWGALFAYAAAGLVLAALALWLYRRRRMESAGDVVAVGVLKPVFKYCMTFGCALCIGGLLYSLSGGSGAGFGLSSVFMSTMFSDQRLINQWLAVALMTVCMLIGAFIGYFGSEMLIHKSFRVWRGRWLGMGVSALIVVALMVSAELDLFGYERRVPDPDRVRSVYIRANGDGVTLSGPENIAAAAELHRSVVANKSVYEAYKLSRQESTDFADSDYANHYRTMSLQIDYELKNGSHLTRSYWGLYYKLDDPGTQTDARAAQTLLNTPEAIASRKATAIDYTAVSIFSATVSSRVLPEDAEKVEPGGKLYVNGEKMGVLEFRDYTAAISEARVVYGDYDITVQGSDGLRGLTAEEAEEMYCTGEWELTSEEAAELYNECILPDMADGTIGTVWLITDEEYENTVYSTQISIDARILREHDIGPTYDYDYFYTVPTVNSVRTNAWLESHGVILRTIAEAGER